MRAAHALRRPHGRPEAAPARQDRQQPGRRNRGAYAPSTKFYLQDKRDGKPWITRLPFPVHVVERVETFDRISRNRFVTRYAYHHGYFDGVEREFRGFGMVEQWDTEELAALQASGELPEPTNIDAVLLRPARPHQDLVSHRRLLGTRPCLRFLRRPARCPGQGRVLPRARPHRCASETIASRDTVLPDGLTVEEEREACRALKGAMLRQEVYALDGTDKASDPYTVTEQNFTIDASQPRAGNRHAVFFTHAREAISYHYERNPADPRIAHALTLEVDAFGNVLKLAAIGYGRRQPDPSLLAADRLKANADAHHLHREPGYEGSRHAMRIDPTTITAHLSPPKRGLTN